MIYSDEAKKKVIAYLLHQADITLGGIKNTYTVMRLNAAAVDALYQIILDNPNLTGLTGMMELIEKEKT